jgi:hypothetical protein
MKCGKEWEEEHGPVHCKFCGHEYIWWKNAKEIMEILYYPNEYEFYPPEKE